MSLLVVLLVVASLPLWITDGVFLTEVLAGLRAGRKQPPALPRGRVALIIPAHNEDAGVGATVAGLIATAPPGTRVLVVAHNCADRTAEIAAAAGAEVARLDEPARRGKGYALDGGRRTLAADPPDVAILVDADCEAEPGALARLAATAERTGRPVQASYLFQPKPGASAVVQVSNFAMLVKNLVRQRGGRRIGAPALMTGSGMAIPWRLFETLDLATGNIVEDLAIGIDFVRRGAPPVFEEGATIWSSPSSEAGTSTQRARWEGGFVATARSLGLPLVAEGLRRGRFATVWMGLHLLTAPLTLLLIANGVCALVWGGLWLAGVAWLPSFIAIGLAVAIVVAVLAAWAMAGRAMLSAGSLVRLPLYMLWKLALYGRIAKGERPAWIRTERVD